MANYTRIWQVNEIKHDLINKIIEELRISEILATALVNRGYSSVEDIKRFLRPEITHLHSPFLLKDIYNAVNRIKKEIDSRGNILIFGDYDVDGVTSVSVLYNFLRDAGANVSYYIPDRFEEGYGLNLGSIKAVCDLKPTLIITVDCGVSAIEEIKYLNSQGIDVIVTDHHECQEELPPAYAIINPKQSDCKYPFKSLAGVGVVFKLVQALTDTIYKDIDIAYKYLDLVALGTVADVMPLVDENRVLVKYGLKLLEETKNLGLRALMLEANIKQYNSYAIGYVIAPRINAAGRLGGAIRAVELFTTDNALRAEMLAKELNQENKNRQDIEALVLEEVLKKINEKNMENDKVIVVDGDNWHHGVVGIVAGRIVERYYRPCIIVSFEDESGRGSGRSIEGFNIFTALENSKHLLEKFGGHQLAGGLSINKNNIEEFRNAINNYADPILTEDKFVKVVKIDSQLKKNHLDNKSIDQLKYLEPCGMGNPAPLFCMSDLVIEGMKTVGDDKHIKLKLNADGISIDAIGFGMGTLKDEYEIGDKFDALVIPQINEFRGNKSLQLILREIK